MSHPSSSSQQQQDGDDDDHDEAKKSPMSSSVIIDQRNVSKLKYGTYTYDTTHWSLQYGKTLSQQFPTNVTIVTSVDRSVGGSIDQPTTQGFIAILQYCDGPLYLLKLNPTDSRGNYLPCILNIDICVKNRLSCIGVITCTTI
jgi:hypothetical protein